VALLRARALARGRDPDRAARQVADALQAGRIEAVGVRDDEDGRLCGLAAWRWPDPAGRTYAQVVLVYVLPVAFPAVGGALVGHVLEHLAAVPTLDVIEVRLRDSGPGLRAAWEEYGFARFERCRMVRVLGNVPVPVVAPPDGYRVVPWENGHRAAVEDVARRAMQGTIDESAVPEAQGDRLVALLRDLRAGRYAGVEDWNAAASFVVLDRKERVVGYVAAATAGENGQLVHLAVHPDHRERGLARVLVIRSLIACQQQGLPGVMVAVTTRNPARFLYNQLGFQTIDCGEVALWWRDGRQQRWSE